MRSVICAAVLMVVVAGVGLAASFDLGYEPEGLDDLKKEKGVFKTTLVRPDADFSRYDSIQTRTPVLAVRAPASSGRGSSTGSLVGGVGGGVDLPEWEDLAELKEIFSRAVDTELGSATDLAVVEGDGPTTLVLRPAITDAVITTSSRYKSNDGEEVPLLTRATVVLDLIDGETGVIVARLAERRTCPRPKKGDAAGDVYPLWPNVADWASSVAADLALQLDRAAAGPAS